MLEHKMRICINADEYGLTKTCTDAIFECFSKGLITTTTMVVNSDCFSYAINKIIKSPFKDKVGLHINLTEGKPLTEGIRKNKKFCNESGCFIGFPNRYALLSKKDKYDVYAEIEAQFNKLLKTGITINHVDSHHHVHNSYSILPIVIAIMKEKCINKLRIVRNTGKLNLIKKAYKYVINARIRPHAYSNYMGSIDDCVSMRNDNNNVVFEIMVHPDYNKKGEIIDRDNGDYDNPLGPVFVHYLEILK